MAEGVVSFLVETLTSLTVNEVNQLRSVGKEILEIKSEFSSMQALLKDADAKEDSNERVKEWVKQVRDVAYETEDILDDFRLLQSQSLVNVLTYLKTKHQLAKRIQTIKFKVSGIAKRKDDYGLRSWDQGSGSQTNEANEKRDPRQDALFIKEVQLVGIDESREKLVQWLIKDDQQNAVLSVYGEGGLGKTTLVKKVFDNKTVMDHFNYCAWVTVSNTFEVKKLLKNLIEQVLNEKEKKDKQDQLKDMDAVQLKEMLRNRLQGNRYVFVFDDIWKVEAWNDLKNTFPDDIERGSRIIVTTRFHDIARECISESKRGLELKLPQLMPEDALKLFCKVAFPSNDFNSCPKDLIEICQKFLQKCKGLPLAIVSVAGLLRTKPAVEWNQVYDNLGYLMRSDKKLEDLNSIISLSYTDLPFHLKSCFLYLCIFPEDYSIRRKKLLQLWVAEGFVERKPGMSNKMTMEDIAKGYLDELINRGLVQAETLDNLTGQVKTCRVHDVLREFITMKAREQGFVTHLDKEGLHDCQVIGRRLSILDDITLLKENKHLFSHLRSFISFDQTPLYDDDSWGGTGRFKLLRVLNIDASFCRPPKQSVSKKLSHLRYLCLTGSRGMPLALPSSIGMLTDLEIVDMKGVEAEPRLPKEILRLKRLRYLYVELLELPTGVGKLINLEHLSRVDAGVEGSSDMVKSLRMLIQMRKLRLTNLKVEDGMQLCTSIEKMKYLRSLSVSSASYGRFCLDVHDLRFPPQDLEKLVMEGQLYTCPHWFPKLQNLMKLTLSGSVIKDVESLLTSLQDLPNLAQLALCSKAFIGEELYFKKGGFARLKQLILAYARNLKKMTVEEGSMPSVETLNFIYCGQLQIAPLGIEYLTTLKSINTEDMLERFNEELRKKVWKAGHSPLISCK